MIKNMIMGTKDPNVVNDALQQGFKVIFVGDSSAVPKEVLDKFVVASSFVPDYNALAMHVDGNERGFVQAYFASLASKAATEMFSAIIACLHNGYGIVIYMPEAEDGLDYIGYLFKFLEYNYGIQTATKSTAFMYNPKFNDRNITLLYLNNLVDYTEFLRYICNLDDTTIEKLKSEVPGIPQNIMNNTPELVKFFSALKDQLTMTRGMIYEGV